MSFEEKHPIGQLFLDVLIAFLLFLAACLFAGTVQQSLTPDQSWSRILWMTIGCIPLIGYLQYRLGTESTKWDFLFFLPVPLLYALIIYFVGNEYSFMIIVALILLARMARDWWMKVPAAQQNRTA